MRHHVTTGLAVLVAFAVSHAFAQTAPPPAAATAPKLPSTSLGIVVFPAKGQTSELQGKDENECYAWSKGQTGVDPLAPPAPAAQPAQAAAAEPAQPADRSRLRGAARGAAAGAVIGEVANDDAGEGAAIGATVGVLKGGAEKRHAEAAAKQQAAQQQQTATQQAQQVTADQKALFSKGFATCLEARSYTVK